jgi:hypothetical protein
MTVKEYNEIYHPKIERIECFFLGLNHAMQKTEDYENAMLQLRCIGYSEEMKESVLSILKDYKKSLLDKLER